MHFVVHALDKADALERRMAVIVDHRAYLDSAPAQHGVQVLLSGPLTSDDGSAMIGSFFLLDAPDRQSIEDLFAADPLTAANVWGQTHINAVAIRQNNMGSQ